MYVCGPRVAALFDGVHWKDTSYDEVGLRAHNIDFILGSNVQNNWEGVCIHIKRRFNLHFDIGFACLAIINWTKQHTN